jgi:hypothetical protein
MRYYVPISAVGRTEQVRRKSPVHRGFGNWWLFAVAVRNLPFRLPSKADNTEVLIPQLHSV